MEEPLFQPFPSEIVFQNFEPHQIYRIPLQLRNNDQVSFGSFLSFLVFYYINLFHPSLACHTKTSLEIKCCANQMTGFYVTCNKGLKPVN